MLEKRKFHRPPANVVYRIDGASYGLDDGLAEAIKGSITRRLEARSLEIPRLPQVAGRILELSQNPSTDIDEVVRAIATDPLLVTRILTIANSAAYGGGEPIQSLSAALMRIGLKVVQHMVFSESIRLRIFSARSYRSILEQSWKLSMGAAVACEALSRATGLEREGAFLLGLLHDTGKPVLVNAISECEKQNGGRPLGDDLVEIVMSQMHEEVGAYVLERWGMAAPIVEAARAHHFYRGAARATPAHKLICAGNLICQHLGVGDVQRDINFTVEHVFADLDLADNERVSPMLEAVARDIEGMMTGLEGAARAA